MISRGTLVGALICGPKHGGEVYAPDESDALLAVAHGVGMTLDTLSSRNDSAIDSLRDQALMLEELRAIPSRSDAAIESLRRTQTLMIEKLDALRSQSN